MPIKRETTVERRPLNNPFTGKPYAPAPAERVDVPTDSPFDPIALRRSELAGRKRNAISRGQLQRQQAHHAADPSAHPVKRLRLSRREGPWSAADLAFVAGCDERTVKRIEAGKDASDLALAAIAVALGVRRDQVDTAWVGR